MNFNDWAMGYDRGCLCSHPEMMCDLDTEVEYPGCPVMWDRSTSLMDDLSEVSAIIQDSGLHDTGTPG